MNRIGSPIDAILGKNQAGFRTGSSYIQPNTYLKTNHGWRLLSKHPTFYYVRRFQKGIQHFYS